MADVGGGELMDLTRGAIFGEVLALSKKCNLKTRTMVIALY